MLLAFGFSINVLTMFGMVLAIGILVDDAIVVVENVERIMSEEGLSPREATQQGDGPDHRRADRHHLVLISVFVPMAFFARLGRQHLPPVLAVDGGVDAVLGVPGAVADAGAVRHAAQAGRSRPSRTRSAASSAGSTAASTRTANGYESWVARMLRKHRPLPADLSR